MSIDLPDITEAQEDRIDAFAEQLTVAIIGNMLTCSRCQVVLPRPSSLAKSQFAECPFVCENCRCADCSIVLDSECDCGERHADRSPDTPQICTECVKIRQRVANLDQELLRLRNSEIAKEDSVYGKRNLKIEDQEND